ncbi:hypothetical protein [Streptomyces sp. GC420]|uniref:hypothetical protein n=1 Tax=Streptomyces sp. GC420 TaxID=2697568 RepID=UPI0014150598|nr:hypothetical protein [Streptomyces sp. GC420]NBM18694.1 hypothetical protein [Streptomyces sp. GC420]
MSRPCAAALLSVMLAASAVACSGGTDGPTPAPATSKPSASTRPPAGETDDALTSRARSAVSAVDIDDPAFVESGVASVDEGVHNRSVLTAGKLYEIVVACAGTGTVQVTVNSGKAQVQDCDAQAASYRIAQAPAELDISIEGAPKASGMVAWQINAEKR